MLKLDCNAEGSAVTIRLEGHLDTTTAPELNAMITQVSPAADTLTLDFAGVEYVSSAGLRVLLSAHKIMSRKGGMTITNACELVKEVFEITGFCDLLNVE